LAIHSWYDEEKAKESLYEEAASLLVTIKWADVCGLIYIEDNKQTPQLFTFTPCS
jgi:hypothetical protein